MAARADLKTVISADMTGFSATMRKAGMLAKTTGAGIGRSIGSATKAMGGLAVQAGKAGIALGAVGAAVGGAMFVRGLKNAADLGGGLADLSARTGILAGDLAVMQRAFEDNGVSADKIGGVINKLQKAIGDAANGSDKLVEAFDGIGISIEDLTSLTPAKQFQAVQSAIAKIEDPTRRAHVAMQLFGKSGGELLTLFADTGAFSGAAKFLGTQAIILNRSSGIFDSISDKLARIPAKLQGFFVGFLEPIAGKVDAILTKFDNYDFAALGLRVAEGFKLDNVAPVFVAMGDLLAAVVGEGIAKGVQVGATVMLAAFSPEGLAFIGSALMDVFKNAFLEIANLGVRLGVALRRAVAGQISVDEIPDAILGKDKGKKSAKDMADLIQDSLKDIDWSPSDNLTDAAKKFAFTMKRLFPESKNAGDESGSGNASKGEDYGYPGLESLYRMQRDKDGGLRPGGAGSQKFKGLGELSKMQSSLERGVGPGIGNAFSQDRERLGVSSGIGGGAMGRWSGRQGIGDASVTGGLGEKRRLRTSANDKESKKVLSIQEQQSGFLESINDKISQSLSVN